jgi:hypothetical protein
MRVSRRRHHRGVPEQFAIIGRLGRRRILMAARSILSDLPLSSVRQLASRRTQFATEGMPVRLVKKSM